MKSTQDLTGIVRVVGWESKNVTKDYSIALQAINKLILLCNTVLLNLLKVVEFLTITFLETLHIYGKFNFYHKILRPFIFLGSTSGLLREYFWSP